MDALDGSLSGKIIELNGGFRSLVFDSSSNCGVGENWVVLRPPTWWFIPRIVSGLVHPGFAMG